jgi:hypothetical protein
MYETVQNNGRSVRETKYSRKADKLDAKGISCVDANERFIVYGTTNTHKLLKFLMNVLLVTCSIGILFSREWRTGRSLGEMRWKQTLHWNVNMREWSVVGWSVVKCSEVLLYTDVLLVLLFFYRFVYGCIFCILCQLAFSDYPDWGFSVLFPQS